MFKKTIGWLKASWFGFVVFVRQLFMSKEKKEYMKRMLFKHKETWDEVKKEYDLVKAKKSNLARSDRDFIIETWEKHIEAKR